MMTNGGTMGNRIKQKRSDMIREEQYEEFSEEESPYRKEPTHNKTSIVDAYSHQNIGDRDENYS